MKTLKFKKKINGFGLVDSILSLSLLAGIITYGIYFSSLRLSTVHYSNLIRSINKEIERDIERLKVDFWSLYYDKENNNYDISDDQCSDFTQIITNLSSWNLNNNTENIMIQSWFPGADRSKVFSGNNVLISRELIMTEPNNDPELNLSIANINYRVEWGENNNHWLSIDLVPEAHGWCLKNI